MSSKTNKGSGKAFGVIIFIGVIITAFLINAFFNKEKVSLKGLIASEKEGIFLDKKITRLLKFKYRIDVEYDISDSIIVDMNKYRAYDFIWPSSQMVLESYKEKTDRDEINAENIVNSPLVIYSWKTIVDQLSTMGIVTQKNGVYYVDLSNLIQLALGDQKWSDIGVDDLYGTITIQFTDPNKSSSGNIFMGLVAYVLQDKVPTEQNIIEILPTLVQLQNELGYMETTSSQLFQQYLAQKLSKPLVVGYENQIIDYAYHYPEAWEALSNEICVLYPVPTIFTTHPLISLNTYSLDLFDALKDKSIQEMIWMHHGFRTALTTASSNPELLNMEGVSSTVSKVVTLPTIEVMEKIMNGLAGLLVTNQTITETNNITNPANTNVIPQPVPRPETNGGRDPRNPPPRRRDRVPNEEDADLQDDIPDELTDNASN